MKIFYGVQSRFYDNGKVEAIIKEFMGNTIPDNSYEEGVVCDTYTDWFASYKEAKQFQFETISA